MKKSAVFLTHLFLWVLVFFTFFNISNAIAGFPKEPGYNPYTDNALYARTIMITITLAIPFYFGYFITPYLFKKQRRKLFISVSVFFGILYPIAMSIMDDGFRPNAITQSFFLFAFLNVFLILGVSFRSLFGWIEQKRLHNILERQNLKSELALLKMQLNPHFLFNTLHNIDTLIREDQDKASKSLIKLSDIMRYMLYDTKGDRVPVEKELEHVRNYVLLEELRIKNERFVKFNVEGNYHGIKIAPMLFIPFIENAFKHSVDSDIENGVIIDFVFRQNVILFASKNQYDKRETEKDKTRGIGLETIKKRLNLLYPNKHTLIIDNNNSIFKVSLEIRLNED